MIDKNFYRVTNGRVELIDCTEADEDYNHYETCIAYAENEAKALALAGMYDREEILADNVWCQECNKPHVALADND